MDNELQPVGGEQEEELPGDELEEQEDPEGGAPEGGEPEGEEEEMPDDLLTDEELAERNARRAAEPKEPQSQARARDEEERSALRAELREIFGGFRQEAPPERGRTQPEPQQWKPLSITPEKATELTEKILADPGGIAKYLIEAVNLGEKRALQRMGMSAEGRTALESSAESLADRYVARKLRDPATKFGKAIEPVFQSMLDDMDLTPLVSMSKADREAWLEETWERAGFRAITQKAGTRSAPSPGVARGAGGRPGKPGSGRVVIKMTDQQKRDLRASAPRLFSGPEGEKRFQRQVWEIEHGVTSDRSVRRATGESMRFADATAVGGM